MKFSLKGKIKDSDVKTEYELHFDNGEVTGDMPVTEALKIKAYILSSTVGNVIPAFNYVVDEKNMLKDAMAVYLLFHEICEDVKKKGETPEFADLEEGAVY